MQKKIRRSKINYSIKTRFQIRVFLKITTIVLLSIAVTSGVFYLYANREIGSTFRQFHVNATNFLDYLIPAILTAAVGGFFMALGITLFFPHTFAGPLYRIERDLKEKIGDGDLTVRFYLRKGDELNELVASIHTMLEKWSLHIKNIESANTEFLHLISQNGPPSAQKLKEVQEKLTAAVKNFKVSK